MRHSLLRALSSRNLRLFFFGQGVSLIGTWLQQAAVSWLVYRKTGSPLLLGTIGFASQIPIFFLAPFAGVLADRWDLRRMLLTTQILAFIQASLLAVCVLTNAVQVWHMVALSLFLGTLNAFDTPARQSLYIDLVDTPANLGNAVALNSCMMNAARLIGPSLAGIIVSAAGEGICFVLNAASFLPIIVVLSCIRITRRRAALKGRNALAELSEGFHYAFGCKPISRVLFLVVVFSLAGIPFTVLLPLFASEVFGAGAGAYGLLMAAVGTGAFCGTIYLASRRSPIGLSRLLPVTLALLSLGLITLSFAPTLALSVPVLALAGFGGMSFSSTANATVQSLVDEDKRGRVMSIFVMFIIGMAPFGSMLAGTLAHHVGPRCTVLLGGLCCLTASVLFAKRLATFHSEVHPVYLRKGLVS